MSARVDPRRPTPWRDGPWSAPEREEPGNATTLTQREEATMRSPLGLRLSRLFLDPDVLTADLLDALATEVARRHTQGGDS